jgi:cytochrome c oxidase subunit IV
LAFCRYCMDFSFSTALSRGAAFMKSEHVVSIKLYAVIFASLIILTLTTTAVSFIDMGGDLNVVVALFIAVCKALLVILYFMHVRYSSRLTWVFVGAGFFWLTILIVLTMSDLLTRTPVVFPGG